jgi:hypothetical protein
MGMGGQSDTSVAVLPRKRLGTPYTGGWVGLRFGQYWCGKPNPPPGFDPRTFWIRQKGVRKPQTQEDQCRTFHNKRPGHQTNGLITTRSRALLEKRRRCSNHSAAYLHTAEREKGFSATSNLKCLGFRRREKRRWTYMCTVTLWRVCVMLVPLSAILWEWYHFIRRQLFLLLFNCHRQQ